MTWDLPRRGLADGLHPDVSFSRVYIHISHDRYIHMMDWRLSHLDWEGWGGGKKTAPWNHYEIWCPQVIKSDNGTSFTYKVTQGVSKALGITYYLLCAWRPQSSGKAERANQFLKSVIKKKKITQETSLGWKEGLPIALLCIHTAPKEQVGLSPHEIHMGDLLFMSGTSS